MFNLIVEGWRAFAQSHSIIAQFHMLELTKRSDLGLFHIETPQPPKGFLKVGAWKPSQLFDTDDETRLAAVTAPPPGLKADAVLRIAIPYDFTPSPRGRTTFVFCVAEGRQLNAYMLAGERTRSSPLAPGVQIITPSRFSYNSLVVSGADPAQIHIVPHGADTRIFHPADEATRAEFRRVRGISEDDFVFLNVSALYRRKGIPILLKAFAQVAARHPRAKLLLKGVDEVYKSRDAVVSMLDDLTSAERAAIGGRIIYGGRTLTYEQLASLYCSADVLVSAYQLEGFNMPVLEAMACGVPVICTAGGPTDEFTQDTFAWRIASTSVETPDGSAQLVPDIDDLIALMERAIADPGFRARAAEVAPQFVAENYTWVKTTDRLFEVLKGAA